MAILKSITAILIFTFLLVIPATAQNSFIGLKSGYGLSELVGDNQGDIKLEPSSSFNIAAVFSSKLRGLPIGLSLEPGYTLKGTQIDADTLKYRFHYLNMPFLMNFYPIDKAQISIGIEPGYLAMAKNHVNDTLREKILSTYNKRLEAALNLGLSFSVSYFMDLGLRYSTSITKVSKQDAIIERRNIRNQYLHIYLLFKIVN